MDLLTLNPKDKNIKFMSSEFPQDIINDIFKLLDSNTASSFFSCSKYLYDNYKHIFSYYIWNISGTFCKIAGIINLNKDKLQHIKKVIINAPSVISLMDFESFRPTHIYLRIRSHTDWNNFDQLKYYQSDIFENVKYVNLANYYDKYRFFDGIIPGLVRMGLQIKNLSEISGLSPSCGLIKLMHSLEIFSYTKYSWGGVVNDYGNKLKILCLRKISDSQLKIIFEKSPKLKIIKTSYYLGNFNHSHQNLEKLQIRNSDNIGVNYSFNELPSLKILDIRNCRNNKINGFPKSLKQLSIDGFNQPLNYLLKNCDNLEILDLGNTFNNSVLYYPKGLKKIIFGNYFDQPIDDLLKNCSDLKILKFGNNFNSNIDVLPNNIEELFFGNNSDQQIDDLLKNCRNLKILKFGNNFNSNIDILPNNIEELFFGNSFNKPINDILTNCSNLKKLVVSGNYGHSLDNLPDTIDVHFYNS